MSIISSEAKWAVLQRVVRLSIEEIRGTTKGKEYEAGFIAGATRRPTDEEIEACARGFFEDTPGPTNWDAVSEVSKQAWLHAAKKALAAVNAMKTKEQQ